MSESPAPRSESLKAKVQEILLAVVNDKEPYRHEAGYTRWGRIQSDINAAIDAAFVVSEKRCGWIPVSERLPTEPRDTIICLAYTPTDCDGDTSVPGAFVASYDDGEWRSRMDSGCWEPGDVTHWMPFPEGPK